MKQFVMALATVAALAVMPAQSRAEEGLTSDTSSGLTLSTAVYRPGEDSAQLTDVRWRRGYSYYYPRSYSYYPRYYNYGYPSYGYRSYGYYPRYNYSYRYNYGYPSYRYGYRYGYRPGISFGFSF